MHHAYGPNNGHNRCCSVYLKESFHTRNAITYIKTHEAVAKLRENLRAEHNVTIEFCAAVFKGVSSVKGSFVNRGAKHVLRSSILV